MRVLRLVVFAAACTVGRGPDPVTARPAPDPDRMPPEVLDKQNPGADTSNHPTLSRSEANPHPWLSTLVGGCDDSATRNSGHETFIGCGGCETRDVSGASNLVLVALAALTVTRRRKRSSRRRNASETRRVARSTHV